MPRFLGWKESGAGERLAVLDCSKAKIGTHRLTGGGEEPTSISLSTTKHPATAMFTEEQLQKRFRIGFTDLADAEAGAELSSLIMKRFQAKPGSAPTAELESAPS